MAVDMGKEFEGNFEPHVKRAAENVSRFFVIPKGARNLSPV
jgi:hypothetical protein